jgi:hypothetical protein
LLINTTPKFSGSHSSVVRSANQNGTDETTSEETEAARGPGINWKLEHGFFAVMGGITVSTKDEYKGLFGDERTITPSGVRALANLDLLPKIDRKKISAKSKSDQIAKALVVTHILDGPTNDRPQSLRSTYHVA